MSIRFFSFAVLPLLALASAQASDSTGRGSIFERYPQEQTFRLSNGQDILLPLHAYQTQGLVLGGLVDLKVLTELLRDETVTPARITGKEGLLTVYSMDYQRMSLGSYREVIFFVAVQANDRVPTISQSYLGLLSIFLPPLKRWLGANTRAIGFYCWKIWVNTETALLAGREVWGYPKVMANVDIRSDRSNGDIRLETATGEKILRASFDRKRSLGMKLPLRMDVGVVTPTDILQTRSRGIGEGAFRIGFFDRDKDTFEINTANAEGAALSALKFRPIFWQQMPDLKAVFLAPPTSDVHRGRL